MKIKIRENVYLEVDEATVRKAVLKNIDIRTVSQIVMKYVDEETVRKLVLRELGITAQVKAGGNIKRGRGRPRKTVTTPEVLKEIKPKALSNVTKTRVTKGGHGKPWSKEDDEILMKYLAKGKKPRHIAPKLGRTSAAVSQRSTNFRKEGVI